MVYLGKFVKGKAVSLFMLIRCLALDYGSEEDIYQDSSSGQGARRPWAGIEVDETQKGLPQKCYVRGAKDGSLQPYEDFDALA